MAWRCTADLIGSRHAVRGALWFTDMPWEAASHTCREGRIDAAAEMSGTRHAVRGGLWFTCRERRLDAALQTWSAADMPWGADCGSQVGRGDVASHMPWGADCGVHVVRGGILTSFVRTVYFISILSKINLHRPNFVRHYTISSYCIVTV